MHKLSLAHQYSNIISLENLLEAWKEFAQGKRERTDVQEFERNFMVNIISLHHDLATKTYRHSAYQAFKISDPKSRDIHKAKVRDRLLHHAVYRVLYPFFNRTFIADSFSCRLGKGTHKARERFQKFLRQASGNHKQIVWILKCDIRKFFASIDHEILLQILAAYIPNRDIVWLLAEIIDSFHSTRPGVGLPLGNLTSQLLVNVYMNRFDQFVKHKLKAKYYVRYADDFVIVSVNRNQLELFLPEINKFLEQKLKLKLHPDKISIGAIASGVDYLGWVHFHNHCVLRTVTKRRMFRRIKQTGGRPETVQSYLGLLSHGNGWKLKKKIKAMTINI